MQLLKNLLSYLSLYSLRETLQPNAHSYDCHQPTGNYQNSCSSRVTPYKSSDPMIAPACHLAATCTTEFVGLAPVENSFFYPAEAKIELILLWNENSAISLIDFRLSKQIQ